ncbi:pyridine nucleotide-disulfide oxidoreductase [Spirochaetia bacterium]|nr:pyridine nucleotide-disulfide oxidoreductase [Spirochaetia bacterium]
MRQMKADIVIIGAGSAGLCAAYQAASAGADVLVADENKLPGGQLFKQIHKFFGSEEHRAGVRGYRIGEQLLEQVEHSGARVLLDSLVYGVFPSEGQTAPPPMGLIHQGRNYALEAKKIIIAAGARENYLPFPGSTLPGVMGAGAAQTLVNLHRVLPGRRVLMVGSGNVGLIVSYQLLQAGAEVAAVLEAAPRIGGYGVHAAKLRRAGVPILVSHTITRAIGENEVQEVEIAALGEQGAVIPDSKQTIAADTVCLAVGLSPMTELAWMCGCRFAYIPAFGGHVPLHSEDMETTVNGVYVAGDITGVEEASTAMEEGNLAGIAAARSLGFLSDAEAARKKHEVLERLEKLRSGSFGQLRRESKTEQLAAMCAYLEEAANGA